MCVVNNDFEILQRFMVGWFATDIIYVSIVIKRDSVDFIFFIVKMSNDLLIFS